MRFRDRVDAGRRLGEALRERLDGADVLVLGLPRGGVPVAAEVAAALGAPLDVIVVRKLGVPGRPELGMGAIGEDGVRVLTESVLRGTGVRPEEVDAVEARERVELERRARLYRGERAPHPIRGRDVVIVDDGIATGGTARAAIEVAHEHGARSVLLAVPVAPRETLAQFEAAGHDVLCLDAPRDFYAVGEWYEDFGQTTDDEVVKLLDAAQA